jgi:hypothetical protein
MDTVDGFLCGSYTEWGCGRKYTTCDACLDQAFYEGDMNFCEMCSNMFCDGCILTCSTCSIAYCVDCKDDHEDCET